MDGRLDGIQMTHSGSFASVRGLPRNSRRVISRVFLDDFGKIVRSRSLKCVRVWNRLSPSPYPLLPRKSSEVPFSSEGWTFYRLGGPGWSLKESGSPENVLVEVLVKIRVCW